MCYNHQGLVYLKNNNNIYIFCVCILVLLFKLIYYNYNQFIYSSDGKAEFSASLIQSLVSHDPSEIILKS